MSEIKWNELSEVGARSVQPGLAGRVLAEAARQRIASQQNRQIMTILAVACLLLGATYYQYDARGSAIDSQRLAQWQEIGQSLADAE